MKPYLIKNATLVNENKIYEADVLIANELIQKIANNIEATDDVEVIDAKGK